MKLSSSDPETDMEMDMTPMIDVVFLLIIFFMIITDMTQQELEDLVLPAAVNAVEDKPDPKQVRPVVNILDNGQIIVKGELLYDPENGDGYEALRGYLRSMAKRMRTEHFTPGDPSTPKIPDDPLLVRADQSTDFQYIQKVMEQCGLEGIKIWKIQFAASESGDKDDEE